MDRASDYPVVTDNWLQSQISDNRAVGSPLGFGYWLALCELKRWRAWAKGCGQMEDTGMPMIGGGFYEMWHPCERIADSPGNEEASARDVLMVRYGLCKGEAEKLVSGVEEGKDEQGE